MCIFSKELGFEITTQCPLECAHCIVESGPKRNERAIDMIPQWVGDGADLDGLEAVVATGGEPFLYPQALAYLSEIARKRGCVFRVLTSASWARTPEKAAAMLNKVLVDHLVVSFDRYHQAFLPFKMAVNALRAGVDCGARCTLNVTAPAKELDADVERATAEIREALGAEYAQRVEVTGQPILRGGRGLTTQDEGLEPWHVFDCCSMVAQHFIKTDGRVIACCGPPAYTSDQSTDWLTLGNLGEMSIAEIRSKAAHHSLVRAIHVLGPAFLYKLAGLAASRLGTRFDTRCSLCVAILSDEELMQAVIVRLEEPAVRRQVALATALIGDLSLLETELTIAKDAT